MATIPDVGSLWWDRDFDDQGRPIRADVRQAAPGLFAIVRGLPRLQLGLSTDEAP